MEFTTTELLQQPEIQKSLIAVMEYLESILAERKVLSGIDILQHKEYVAVDVLRQQVYDGNAPVLHAGT